MWLLMKRLLALSALVMMTAVSAQATITFGVAPAADSLIQSVPQAQRFGAYLEKRLGEPVDVRIFPNDRNLKEALNTHYDVDLAVVRGNVIRRQPTNGFKELANSNREAGATATADMIVVRQGLDRDLLSRIQTVVSGMDQDPEGHALLYNFGIQRFSLPETTKPALPASVAHQVNTFRSASSRRSKTSPSRNPSALTLGIVAAPGDSLSNKEAAEKFASRLALELKSPVTLRTFKDEATLHDWLNRFRMIELGLVSGSYLQKQPAGEFERLAQPADLFNQGLTADSWLVARQGLAPRQLDRLSNSLQQIKGAPLVSLPSRPYRPVPATVSAPTKPSAVFAPAIRSAAKLTFGAVPAADAPLRNEEEVRTFARLLGNRIGTTVNARTFKDQEALQEWLSRFRMVDIGLFAESYLQKQPAGEFTPLLRTSELGAGSGSRLVARQGLNKALQARVLATLRQMKTDPEVARLFQAPSPTVRVTAPEPVAPRPAMKPEPVVVEAPAPPPVAAPKPVITEAPAPAPIVKPTVPPAPPVIEPPPVPAIPEPQPEPAEPPVIEVKIPPLRPEPPDVVFRPSPGRQQVYLAPFITVMVPGGVAEEIFDTFVDKLNADGLDQQYEFIILKGGLDSVDQAWLAERNYVTGEIFGYVEESGCCSTDIRTKSRVFLFKKGSAKPVVQHEHPVKIFFDHDYSTIEKERQNIADNIANELATKIRDALSGS